MISRAPGSPMRWVLLGFLMLQLTWMAVLPPFAGVDEFDHVYRASSVAHGEWVSNPEAATRGTGATVSVSRGIVDAARPECEALDYTGPEDCVGQPQGDRVEIASGAGRYNPLFYALVGYPTALLDGVHALYGMRLVSSLLCLGLLAAALSSLRSWASSRVLVAVGVGLTPTVVYTTSVVAPNGLEIMAGLGLWAGLAGIAHTEPGSERRHLLLAAVSGALLLQLRSLGPLWAVLILGSSLVAWPSLGRRVRDLLGRASGRWVLVVAVLSGVGSLAWTLSQRSLVIGLEADPGPVSLGFRLARAAQELPLWLLQAIAAFPRRGDAAPLLVYPCYLILLGFLLVVGLRWADVRLRASLALTVTMSFAIPFAITVATLAAFGTSWQGRYVMPYLIGGTLLVGAAWARRPDTLGLAFVGPAWVLMAVSHATGLIAVGARESPLTGSDLWVLEMPMWLLTPCVLAATAMFTGPMALALLHRDPA